jgi:ubiquinone biosynthesis protein
MPRWPCCLYAVHAGRHNIRVPADLLLFFKSIIAIEGMGRKIDPAFDFLQYSLEFAGELVKIQYGPDRIMGEFTQVIRESKTFIHGLPRQLNFFLRKINSPDHAIRIDVKELKGLKIKG